MMPIGVPRVPYRTPQSGGWQWVDIWNCLVSLLCAAAFLRYFTLTEQLTGPYSKPCHTHLLWC